MTGTPMWRCPSLSLFRLYQLGRKHLQAIKQAKTADAYAGAE
jgi:hypothetical protein